ncbi:META domain-containing protein [Paraflavitalea soli]|uniref:META domain-containing protein n=1 Tax=Paraflavitalea soli TaxID=2315862 RepID=A0A3B7MUR2_9BACT|nr:META domain-containing protein [Paraflavitalea soli]AXY76746.1 META domain-containing protein [Paraflavitalea soli]
MQNLFLTGIACALLAASLVANKDVHTGPQETSVDARSNTKPADTSLNGEWFLQPVLASDTAAGKFPSIKFNVAKGTFTGNTGCNRMNGTFKRTDTSLTINEHIVVTKMVCPGFNEAAFLKTLLNTNRYKKENDVLVLMFDQTELSRWTRKPYRAPMSKGI